MIKNWFLKDAHPLQFWMPQSGLSGGMLMGFVLLITFLILSGCGTETLPKPNTAKTAGVEALVAYGLAAHVANQYLALPTCTKPLTAVPCKTDDIAVKVKAADLAAYNAAVAADAAVNNPNAQASANTALTNLKNANASANGGKQ